MLISKCQNIPLTSPHGAQNEAVCEDLQDVFIKDQAAVELMIIIP